jgi:hypothetical protein
MIPFGTRLKLAFSALFSILFRGELAERVLTTFARTPEPVTPPPAPAPPPPPDPGHRAAQVLSLLQRDGRLIDFLMEDLTPYPDAQIGAAVRDVHRGSREALDRYFTLEPVVDDEEGRPVAIERSTDAARIKLVGNLAGQPPARGVLRHRGWEATRIELPPLPVSGRNILAPAEIEIS